MGEIDSLWLYRISIVTSLIICAEVESFKIKRFLALHVLSAGKYQADVYHQGTKKGKGDSQITPMLQI
jgi:hypothetical protein